MKITQALVAEHGSYLAVFDQIEQMLPHLTEVAEARALARLVAGMLGRHCETEKELAIAALDHMLHQNGPPGQWDRFQRMHHEHDENDASLKEAQEARRLVDAIRALRRALRTVRAHFQEEEQNVFPLLNQMLGEESLKALGHAWMQIYLPQRPGVAFPPAARSETS